MSSHKENDKHNRFLEISEAIHKAEEEGKVPVIEVGKIHKDPYLVLSGYSASNLKNLVINAINNGYEPCGGLASNAMGDLFQAMVLKEMVK